MLLGNKEALEDYIIRLLSRRPNLDAEKIRLLINKNQSENHAYSRAAVYKELKKLTESSVLFKYGKLYCLHLNWAIDFLLMGEAIASNYLQLSPSIEFMPEEGKKRRWKLDGFLRLMAFLDNITIYLMRNAKSRHCLVWYPRSWFWLVRFPDSKTFFRAVRACRVHSWRILGSSAFIDRAGTELWDPQLVTWSFAESPFSRKSAQYFHVIDDVIIEFSFDKAGTAHVEKFMETIKTRKDLSPEAVSSFFEARVRATLSVERNAKRASLIRREFEDYFGEKIV